MDTACLEQLARTAADELGLQPRTHLVYFTDLDAFRAAQRPADRPAGPAPARMRLRGECAKGRCRAQRLIYLNPQLGGREWLETATHETAHALVPWRQHHTATWLALHLATLAGLSSPGHAEKVAGRLQAKYDITSRW